MNGPKLKTVVEEVMTPGPVFAPESILDWKLLKERPDSGRKDFATPNQMYIAMNSLDYFQKDKWQFTQVTTLGKGEYPNISGIVKYKVQVDTDAKRPKVSSGSSLRKGAYMRAR